MQDHRLVVDLALAVVAAFVGGTLAHRIGQPVILGYLLAGVAIGPFTPGPTASPEAVQVLAEIGVALLMFALGAEVSLVELRRIGRVAIVGGVLQIVCTMGLGPLLAPHLGLSFAQGIFLGALRSAAEVLPPQSVMAALLGPTVTRSSADKPVFGFSRSRPNFWWPCRARSLP
jgi:CPA2 family monovalent cation:H+ antiporter-2